MNQNDVNVAELGERGLDLTEKRIRRYLDAAHGFAMKHSGCKKVQVGACIVNSKGYVVASGANRAIPDLCKSTECMRIQKYGEASKEHRLPSDCRAIHSEIDAICRCAINTRGKAIFVTRYPCEACARAIVAAGLSVVVYGRKQKISDETAEIFNSGNVFVMHADTWDAEDTTV